MADSLREDTLNRCVLINCVASNNFSIHIPKEPSHNPHVHLTMRTRRKAGRYIFSNTLFYISVRFIRTQFFFTPRKTETWSDCSIGKTIIYASATPLTDSIFPAFPTPFLSALPPPRTKRARRGWYFVEVTV